MIRFEIDPSLSAEAIRDGRKLVVEVFRTPGGVFKKVTLGPPTPYTKEVIARILGNAPVAPETEA